MGWMDTGMRRAAAVALLLCGLAMGLHGAAEPSTSQAVTLSAGWNPVALSGTPLEMDKFLALNPMVFDAKGQVFVRCTEKTALRRGTAVWIYSDTAKTVEVSLVKASATADPATPATGWSLVGAVEDEPPWLSKARRLVLWDAQQRYRDAPAPAMGQGVWLDMAK